MYKAQLLNNFFPYATICTVTVCSRALFAKQTFRLMTKNGHEFMINSYKTLRFAKEKNTSPIKKKEIARRSDLLEELLKYFFSKYCSADMGIIFIYLTTPLVIPSYYVREFG